MTKEHYAKAEQLAKQIVDNAITIAFQNALESDLLEEFIEEIDWTDNLSLEDENQIRLLIGHEQCRRAERIIYE